MKSILFGIIAIIGLAVTLQSCNEDIELIGDFRETAIVYGILDQADSIHMIKVTRAFIGDGSTDNNQIASIPDSSYFESVTGTVTEFVNNSPTGRVFTLTDTLVENKDQNGIFYAPTQKLYCFYTSTSAPLLGNATYKLNLNINNGDFTITGTTPMVDGMTNNISAQSQPYKFINNDGTTKATTVTVTNSNDDKFASQINVKLRVEFTEWVGATPTIKSFDWNIGELPASQGDALLFTANGQKFYDLVAANCTNNPAIDKRTFNSITTVITGGAQDLVNYILVNEPSSSLAQSKPTFTNLTASNDHPVIGIFSARQTVSVFKPFIDPSMSSFIRVIDKKTTEKLCTGSTTGLFMFCSDHPADATEPWAC